MVTAFTIQNVNIRLVRVDETKDVLINFEKRRWMMKHETEKGKILCCAHVVSRAALYNSAFLYGKFSSFNYIWGLTS